MACPAELLMALRDRIRRIERPAAAVHGVLPFRRRRDRRRLAGRRAGIAARCTRSSAAAATRKMAPPSAGFAAGDPRTDRRRGLVLWCSATRRSVRARPCRARARPGRLVLVPARATTRFLWAWRKGCARPWRRRRGGRRSRPAADGRGTAIAARRRASGVTALLLRRWRDGAEAGAERERPSAAMTRWRIAALPSLPGAREPGIGAPRWRVELLRCRGARAGMLGDRGGGCGGSCICCCRTGRSTGCAAPGALSERGCRTANLARAG